jgi:hypothetical protein
MSKKLTEKRVREIAREEIAKHVATETKEARKKLARLWDRPSDFDLDYGRGTKG